MYFFRDDTSPNDLISEQIDTEGKLATEMDSPYHGDYNFTHPIRVAPDGSVVIIGSGRLFDARSLATVGTLPNAIFDAAWNGGILYSIHGTTSSGTSNQWPYGPLYTAGELQSWSAAYAETNHALVTGLPLRVFSFDSGLLVVSLDNGLPRFSTFNANLLQTSIAPAVTPPVVTPPVVTPPVVTPPVVTPPVVTPPVVTPPVVTPPVVTPPVVTPPLPVDLRAKGKGVYYISLPVDNGVTWPLATPGWLKISLGAKGTFTGTLSLGKSKKIIRGLFDSAGTATVRIPGRPPVIWLLLQLKASGTSVKITGTLGNATRNLSFGSPRAWRRTGKESAPQAGRYTFYLSYSGSEDGEIPSVPGVGRLLVRKSGAVSMIASTVDCAPFAASSQLAEDGSFVIHGMTYAGQGGLSGVLQFEELSDSDCSGDLRWIKPLQPDAEFYRGDLDVTLGLYASRYISRANPVEVNPLAAPVNSMFSFDEGDLREPVEQPSFLTRGNRIAALASPLHANFNFRAATGDLSGQFTHPRLGTVVPLTGVLFQKLNICIGYFPGISHFGRFTFEPRLESPGSSSGAVVSTGSNSGAIISTGATMSWSISEPGSVEVPRLDSSLIATTPTGTALSPEAYIPRQTDFSSLAVSSAGTAVFSGAVSSTTTQILTRPELSLGGSLLGRDLVLNGSELTLQTPLPDGIPNLIFQGEILSAAQFNEKIATARAAGETSFLVNGIKVNISY
jgi:hypothetical protein